MTPCAPRIRWAATAILIAAVATAATPARAATPPTRSPRAASTQSSGADALSQAKKLSDQGQYAQSNALLEGVLKDDPNNTDARLLREINNTRLAAAASRPARPSHGITLLTPRQVSAIRLAELGADETHLIGKIDRKTLQQFWNDVMTRQPGADISRNAEQKFLATDNFTEQVMRIKASGQAKYIDKIQLRGDPADMVAFRRVVHPFVLQNCATARCHAGNNGGDFRLIRPAGVAVSDQILYTNFYLLTTYERKAANGTTEKMIDRDYPRKSLLLQYGLPKNVSANPHPGAVQVRRLVSENSDLFKATAAWIKGLAFPQPNYGIAPPENAAAPATSTSHGP